MLFIAFETAPFIQSEGLMITTLRVDDMQFLRN